MKPLPKILIGLACLALLVFGRWFFWSSLFPVPAKPSGFPNRETILATNREAVHVCSPWETNNEPATNFSGPYLGLIRREAHERRALASFLARMEHVQRLRELAIFPPEDELLGLWDLPEAERERVLQVRREMVEAAVQRMSEASAIEAESWKELRETLGNP